MNNQASDINVFQIAQLIISKGIKLTMKVTGHRTLVALLSRYYAENLVGMLVASLFFSHK